MVDYFAEDQVYMEDEAWRDECILNETGKIYTGNWEQIGHRPWNYAQVRMDFFLLWSSYSSIWRSQKKTEGLSIWKLTSEFRFRTILYKMKQFDSFPIIELILENVGI